MPSKLLREFLKEHHIKHKMFLHSSSYTGQQLAHASHISGEKVAKAVVLKTEAEFIIAVLPACYKVKFAKLKGVLGKQELRLATEAELRKLFPDCEIGALPPFGNIYHLKVYVDESLTHQPEFTFSAGNHREAMQIKYADFSQWTKPEVQSFAVHY